jgi:hypothetical protein
MRTQARILEKVAAESSILFPAFVAYEKKRETGMNEESFL